MRPLAVVLFALVVLGSLYGYLAIAERPFEATNVEFLDAKGDFKVVLTLPFDTAASGFEIEESAPSLTVQLDGNILLRKDSVGRGEITIEQVDGVKLGRNEFLVTAQPKSTLGESGGFSLDDNETKTILPVPIRLQIYQNDILVGEKTTWNQPGLRLVSTIIVEIKPEFEAD